MKSILQIILLSIIFTLSLNAQVPRKVIVEHFTNTKCPICKNRNPGFYANLSTQPGILHLAVHPSSPYSSCILSQQNQPDNDDRTKFYGVYGSTPRLVLQGTAIPSNADYNSSALFAPYLNKTSPIQLTILQTKYASDSIHVKIKIKAVADNTLGSLKLFGALAEDTIFYASPNGEKEHYDVYRKSLFGSTGITVSVPGVSGNEIVYEVTSPSNALWVFSRIYVLALLQDPVTKEVIQAEATNPSDNDITTGTKFNEIELAAKVYPNPARSILNIELEHGESSTAILRSLDGKLIRKEQFSGSLILDVQNLPKTTYLLEIQSGKSKTIRKVQVE